MMVMNAPINVSTPQLELDLDKIEEENEKPKKDENKVTTYAMFILGILTLIRIAT